jgi:hypothetical protein
VREDGGVICRTRPVKKNDVGMMKMEKDEGSDSFWYSDIPKYARKNSEDINLLSGIFSVFLSLPQWAIKISLEI